MTTDPVATTGNFRKCLQEVAVAKARLAYEKTMNPARLAGNLRKNKCLYFALCGDVVKIGVSSDPDSRVQILQTGAPGPLSLLNSIPNAGHLEAVVHRRMSHLHVHGEWFRYTPEIDSLIEELQCKDSPN